MSEQVKCVDCLLCGHDNGWLGSTSKTCQKPFPTGYPGGVKLCGCHCVFPTAPAVPAQPGDKPRHKPNCGANKMLSNLYCDCAASEPAQSVAEGAEYQDLWEAAEKATQGEWDATSIEMSFEADKWMKGDNNHNDAAFIALANPTRIKQLISALQNYKRDIAELKAQVNDRQCLQCSGRITDGSCTECAERDKHCEETETALREAVNEREGLKTEVERLKDSNQVLWQSVNNLSTQALMRVAELGEAWTERDSLREELTERLKGCNAANNLIFKQGKEIESLRQQVARSLELVEVYHKELGTPGESEHTEGFKYCEVPACVAARNAIEGETKAND